MVYLTKETNRKWPMGNQMVTLPMPSVLNAN